MHGKLEKVMDIRVVDKQGINRVVNDWVIIKLNSVPHNQGINERYHSFLGKCINRNIRIWNVWLSKSFCLKQPSWGWYVL